MDKKKVAVGISGGVDSAVAAALLKKQGYEVIGVHLYCYDEGPYCTAPEDRKMAVRVAQHLNVPLLVWDLHRQYNAKVIRYFFDEYKAGRTPNPDIVCNREIKFGIFMKKALRDLRVDYVATGHYARIKKDKNGDHLLRGVDESKDQSYFLYDLAQKQLEQIMFPIGGYLKKEIRKIAQELNLPNKERPDSQGICFIGPVPVAKFLRERLPAKAGPVVNTKGEIIGEHDGVWFFTEGQRHGFRLFKTSGLPLYVIGKNVAKNTLIVGRGGEAEVGQFEIEKPHWIGKLEDNEKRRVGVRIRHLGEIMPATISNANQPLITLAKPVFGVAPGQSAVFYRRNEVLGGGVISDTSNPVVGKQIDD
jgi:tRNA-specific 2-thiouridylase